MECIFCSIINGDAESWKVYEDELVVAFFDIFPAAPLHTLVVPKAHFTDIYDVAPVYLEKIMDVCKTLAAVYKKEFGITDVNLIHGSGKAAQQDVFHFHMHIVPRFEGDSFKLHYDPNLRLRDDFKENANRVKTALAAADGKDA